MTVDTESAGHQEGPGRRPRVPPHQPPARLPGVRQGRRVPAAGPDDRLRPGREPLRRGEAALREADPDQRPGAARPRALHPLRPLHPLRQGGGRRPADPLHRPGQRDPGQHLPRPPVRLVLQRQHRADLPGRRAHRHAVPVQGPPVGPRAGRVHLHDLLGRLPHRRRSPRRNEVLRYQRRRHRPGQLGLAVRQGPLRLRGRQLRRPPRRPAGARRGDAAARGRRWSDALRRAADGHRGRPRRRRPAGIGVLGGARLTNEAAYAWAKLAKGVLGTDNVDAQLGDGLPAELVLGLPRATIDEVCAPAARSLLLGPDLKEELPVLFLRLRHAVVERRRHARRARPGGHRPRPRSPRVAPLPARRAPVAAGRRAARRRRSAAGGADADAVAAGRRDAARPTAGHRRRSAGRRWPSPATPSPTPPRVARRRPPRGPVPAGPAPGQRPRRPRHGPGARPAARAGHASTTGADWFGDRWATRARRARASTPPASSQAAADGRIDTLVLLGADPLADFPDRDLADAGLAGARTVIAVDLFLTESAAQADVVLPAAGFAEVDGHDHQPRGPGQRARPEGHAARHRPRRLDDRRRARPPPRRRPRPRVARATSGTRSSAVAPAHAGITARAARAPTAATAWSSRCPRPASTTDAEVAEAAGPTPRPPSRDADVDDGRAPTPRPTATQADARRAPPATPRRARRRASPTPTTTTPRPRPTPPAPSRRRSRPAPCSRFAAPDRRPAPPLDAYSLRLVATRKLYDQGTLVQHSPSLAGLADAAPSCGCNPYDLDRLGVAAGGRVRVTSQPRPRSPCRSCPTPACPRGIGRRRRSTSPAAGADRRSSTPPPPVTDVRVETTCTLIARRSTRCSSGDVDLGRRRSSSCSRSSSPSCSCSSPVMFMIWFERKVIADMQNRIGPNRAGPVRASSRPSPTASSSSSRRT